MATLPSNCSFLKLFRLVFVRFVAESFFLYRPVGAWPDSSYRTAGSCRSRPKPAKASFLFSCFFFIPAIWRRVSKWSNKSHKKVPKDTPLFSSLVDWFRTFWQLKTLAHMFKSHFRFFQSTFENFKENFWALFWLKLSQWILYYSGDSK